MTRAPTAFAIWSTGAIVVPIYPTNSPEECEWVAGNSGAVAAICGTADHLGKLRQVQQVPAVQGELLCEGLFDHFAQAGIGRAQHLH